MGENYLIYWKFKDNRENGKVHHGKPTTKELAKAWVEYGNKEFPEIYHWYGGQQK